MDVVTIAGMVVGGLIGVSVPTWVALHKINYKQGVHTGTLKAYGERLNRIEKKIDTLNGNVKK